MPIQRETYNATLDVYVDNCGLLRRPFVGQCPQATRLTVLGWLLELV
jgi:hypothetical protein